MKRLGFLGSIALLTGVLLALPVALVVSSLFQGGGVYSYSNLQNIAADCPPDAAGCVPLQDANTGRHYTSFNQAFDLRPGGVGGLVFNTSDYSFFVQDTWRVNRALTLNHAHRNSQATQYHRLLRQFVEHRLRWLDSFTAGSGPSRVGGRNDGTCKALVPCGPDFTPGPCARR